MGLPGEGKQKPREQYYGGDADNERLFRNKYITGRDAGDEREAQGLNLLNQERYNNEVRTRNLDYDVRKTQNDSDAQYGALLRQNEEAYDRLGRDTTALRDHQLRSGLAYGSKSDEAFGDYRAGRQSILDNASAIERNAARADADYKSAADAAFQASQAKAQRNALSLAAGRGGSALRTAMATSDAAQRQAALDQQVVKAQEANQLLAMKNDALANAAQIRTGVGTQDQSAASLQAQRQAQANANVGQYQGQNASIVSTGQAQRGNIIQANATNAQNTNAQRMNIGNQNAAYGAASASAQIGSGAGMRSDYLGASTSMEGAKLGADLEREKQRQQFEKENSPEAKFGKAWGMITDPIGLFG